MGERTIGILPVFMTLLALQLVLALILAALLGAFHRLYRHAYLRDWSWSWLAFVAYALLSAVSGVTWGDATTPLSALWSAASLIAGYLQIAWLLLGAWGLAWGKDVPQAGRRRATAGAIVAGLGTTALAALPGPSPLMLRCLVAGVAYLAGAVVILARPQPVARLGRTVAGLALFVYAADQLAYFGLGFVPHSGQLRPLLFLCSFDLLATALIGLALVAWPLEGERERQLQVAALARRRERAQACAYRVSEAADTVGELGALFRSLHESLGEVLPARNFYIALHDAAAGTLSFPYFADERDEAPAPKPLGRGLTEYVLRTRSPLLATPEVFRELVARGEVELIASDSVDWLGAPLVVRDEVIGVAAVQTYDPGVRLSAEDRDLFVFVCGQIAAAIEARRAEQALRSAAREESLGVLAGGVAHDFNNLLAAILGHAALAVKQLPADSPARSHVEKAARVAERASDLTRQMLAYSGQGRFEVTPVDLSALVRENLPLLEVTLPKGVRLDARLADELPPVDPTSGSSSRC
jgi:GAF domain-containing protein